MKHLLVLLAIFICPFSVFAITAAEVVITTQISERAPVDRVEVYRAQNGKLYCFSRIEGATEETSIEHIWLYQGREMARVNLPVRSTNWRTYSSKKIVPEWTGAWEVRVVDSKGTLLDTARFRIE